MTRQRKSQSFVSFLKRIIIIGVLILFVIVMVDGQADAFRTKSVHCSMLLVTEKIEQHTELRRLKNISWKHNPGKENTLKIFSNFETVMDMMESNRPQMALQTQLVMQAFREDCASGINVKEPLQSKMPFIVIEGNTVEEAQNTAKQIAMLINGKYISIPPHCLHRFTYFFQKGTLMRRIFFALARYATAYTCMKTLDRPTVVSGYWYDHVAFVLARLYATPAELPPPRNPIYRLPRDLLKPDLLFYMYFPYQVANQPFTTKAPFWKPKLVQIYERFDDVYFINVMEGKQKATNQILDIVMEYLKERFNSTFPYYV